MFRINFQSVRIVYAGCPEDGIPAVDWRRAHNLPDAPYAFCALIDPPWVEDEAIVRRFADLANADADLAFGEGNPLRTVALSVELCELLRPLHVGDRPTLRQEQRTEYASSLLHDVWQALAEALAVGERERRGIAGPTLRDHLALSARAGDAVASLALKDIDEEEGR